MVSRSIRLSLCRLGGSCIVFLPKIFFLLFIIVLLVHVLTDDVFLNINFFRPTTICIFSYKSSLDLPRHVNMIKSHKRVYGD